MVINTIMDMATAMVVALKKKYYLEKEQSEMIALFFEAKSFYRFILTINMLTIIRATILFKFEMLLLYLKIKNYEETIFFTHFYSVFNGYPM